MRGGAFFNGKEGRDDFRKSLILKKEIYDGYTNHYYDWRCRQPLLAYVNPRLPKKFIDVMGVGRSLIQLTVDRLKPICPVENMWVVTNEKYISIVKEQIPDMPVDNILAEPEARNTAPCIAYACWKIQKKHPKANIVVTPSDALGIHRT